MSAKHPLLRTSARMDEDVKDEGPSSGAHLAFRTRLAAYKYNSPYPSPSKSIPRHAFHSPRIVESESEHDTPKRVQKRKRCSWTDSEDELPALRRVSRRTEDHDVSESSEKPRKKGKKPARPYAPPETYEHLHMLPDHLEQYLDCMFYIIFWPYYALTPLSLQCYSAV